MTELLQAEFEDETGTTRRLTRTEVLNVVNLLAAAGNETTTRLIGWTGKVLADHPDERRKLVEDRSLVPNAIEELLRFEPPSPTQARYVMHGRRAPRAGGPRGQRDPAAQRLRQPRRRASSPTATASTSPARSTTTWRSATDCTSAWAPPWPGSRGGWPSTRCCSASPTWEVDWDNAKQARTSTVRGWERLPVVFELSTIGRRPASAGRRFVAWVSMRERGRVS